MKVIVSQACEYGSIQFNITSICTVGNLAGTQSVVSTSTGNKILTFKDIQSCEISLIDTTLVCLAATNNCATNSYNVNYS